VVLVEVDGFFLYRRAGVLFNVCAEKEHHRAGEEMGEGKGTLRSGKGGESRGSGGRYSPRVARSITCVSCDPCARIIALD
jgi:hypothetical protein